jgi:hypothetical protein
MRRKNIQWIFTLLTDSEIARFLFRLRSFRTFCKFIPRVIRPNAMYDLEPYSTQLPYLLFLGFDAWGRQKTKSTKHLGTLTGYSVDRKVRAGKRDGCSHLISKHVTQFLPIRSSFSRDGTISDILKFKLDPCCLSVLTNNRQGFISSKLIVGSSYQCDRSWGCNLHSLLPAQRVGRERERERDFSWFSGYWKGSYATSLHCLPFI